MLLRRIIQTTAALAAAVLGYSLVTLPAARIHISTPLPENVVVGAYHIHTTRSDGAGTPDEVAAAAAKAGVRFAILTDHDDATRPPDAPRYVNGVLLIDAVEISAVEGHVVALGLTGPAPYRLGGEGRDVIEDIHRLGGYAIIAHPDSPRLELRWRAANTNGDLAGADGLEWLNADTEWRTRRWPQILNAVLHMPFRPAESIAQLLDRPTATMRRWDSMSRRRATLGLAAVDAHGVVAGLYTGSFKSFTQAVILDGPLTHDAASDATRVLQALRSGRTFTVTTGIADPVLPSFTARDQTRTVSMGERLTAPAGPVFIEAAIPAALGARVAIMHHERPIAEGMGRAEVSGAEPGAYRVEAWLGTDRVPWIVTNPIYVDPPKTDTAPSESAQAPGTTPVTPSSVTMTLPYGPEWAIEHGPSSSGAVANSGTGLQFQWTVGTVRPGDEFSALAHSIADATASFDRIEFTARAASPMRLSVQFRLPGGRDGERWGRSVYIDTTPRPITVRMVDVVPQGFSATRRPVVARIKSVLFVVDTLNTAPGSHGVVELSDIRLARSPDPVVSGPYRQQAVRGSRKKQ
jgi:hypothetical protein